MFFATKTWGATDPLPHPYSATYGLITTHRTPNEYDSTIGNHGYVHTEPGDRLEILTWHFIHTGPFNNFAPFTRNFERLGV